MKRVIQVVKSVGLDPYHVERYPHEFSGGQRQRIGIARALVLSIRSSSFVMSPFQRSTSRSRHRFLTCCATCRQPYHLTYLFIAHNLAVVKHISDRIGVLYLGKMIEIAHRMTTGRRYIRIPRLCSRPSRCRTRPPNGSV